MPWHDVAAAMPQAENSETHPRYFVPDSHLELQHVLGYTGDEATNNLAYLPNGTRTLLGNAAASSCTLLTLCCSAMQARCCTRAVDMQ